MSARARHTHSRGPDAQPGLTPCREGRAKPGTHSDPAACRCLRAGASLALRRRERTTGRGDVLA